MSVAPYPGLRPYDEEERDNFFGRETDSKILIDQILANRLTLLFAATGVGKSSLLRASVIPRLKEPLGENLDVVFFNDWVAPPLPNLKRVILTTLHEQGDLEQDVIAQEVVDAPLSGFLEFCCLFTSQPFLIVLDQFEEFFRYRGNYPKEHSQALIDQLTEVILNKAIPVAVVLSMREDYALELNDFKPRLPMILFENYYRLEKLTREAAMDAIQIPAQRVGFKYEGVLFELLLKDLLSRELDRSKGSMVADTIETVEPPYLQIICSQLWMRDQNDPEKTIRYTTYEKAGGAKGLLDNFIGQDVMSKFSFAEKQLASKAFDHLVSRRGTKMPHTVEDLSQMLNVNPDELRKVLDKLEKNRVLRRQQREKKVWYELYHDMFSHSIDDWNTGWKNRIRARKGIISGGLLVMFGSMIFVGYDTFINYSYTHLRMDLSDPHSVVELWQGKKDSWDVLGQKKFIAQTDIKVKDREPDKRQKQWDVDETGSLTAELIGALPLDRRVIEFSQDGQHINTIKIAKESILNVGNVQSRSIISNLLMVDVSSVNNLLFDLLGHVRNSEVRNEILQIFASGHVDYWLQDEALFQNKFSGSNAQQKDVLVSALSGNYLAYSQRSLLMQQLEEGSDEGKASAAKTLGELGCSEVIPLLADLLLKNDHDDNVRLAAVNALGNIGASSVVPELLFLLNDKNTEIRSSALMVLSGIGGSDVAGELIKFLKVPGFNSEVAGALAEIGDSNSIQSVVDYINDAGYLEDAFLNLIFKSFDRKTMFSALKKKVDSEKKTLRSPNVIKMLARFESRDYLPVLESLLSSKDDGVLYAVILAMGKSDSPHTLQKLTQFIGHDSQLIRSAVTRVFERLSESKDLPQLAKMLTVDQSDVRISAIRSIKRIRNVDFSPMLIPLLEDKSADVRIEAVNALYELSYPNIFSVVSDLILREHDRNVGIVAISVLKSLGFEYATSKFLIESVNNYDTHVRARIIWSLGVLGNLESRAFLVDQLKYNNADIRSEAIKALGEFKTVDVIPDLTPMLMDFDVRFDTIEVLGDLGYSLAIPALSPLLNDENPKIRLAVVRALGKIHTHEVLPLLVDRLKDDDIEVRASSVNILKQLESPSVVPSLINQLDDDAYVKSKVLSALVSLAQAEILPIFLESINGYSKNYSIPNAALIRPELIPVLRKTIAGKYYRADYNELGILAILKRPEIIMQVMLSELSKRQNYSNRYTAPYGGYNVYYYNNNYSIYSRAYGYNNYTVYDYNSQDWISESDRNADEFLSKFIEKFDINNQEHNGLIYFLSRLKNNKNLLNYLFALIDKYEKSNDLYGIVKVLGKVGQEEAIPILIALLESNEDYISDDVIVDALGDIGKPSAIPSLLKLLTSKNEYYRARVVNSLGKIGGLIQDDLLKLLKNDSSDLVRIYTAVALWKLGAEEGYHYVTNAITRNSSRKINLAFNDAIKILVDDKDKLFQIVESEQYPEIVRSEVLSILLTKPSQSIVPSLLKLLDKNENLFDHKIWQVMGDLKVVAVRERLQSIIDEIQQQYLVWRIIRDDEKPESTGEETQEYINARLAWEQKLKENKPEYVFPYAYNLSRIDKKSGIKLLGNEIAEIRRGAWYGLSTWGDVSLIKELAELRWDNKDNALLRHAIYRAIDHSLYIIQHNSKRNYSVYRYSVPCLMKTLHIDF